MNLYDDFYINLYVSQNAVYKNNWRDLILKTKLPNFVLC